MSKKEMLNQESAFPDPMRGADQSFYNQEPTRLSAGMSKRFYAATEFAKVFAEEYFKKDSHMKHELRNPRNIAKIAFEFADALLSEELNKEIKEL